MFEVMLMLNFTPPDNIYADVMNAIGRPIDKLFVAIMVAFNQFSAPILAAAAIYVALLGYTIMAGKVSMSMHEAAVKISKVVLIIVLVNAYGTSLIDIYKAFWQIPAVLTKYFINVVAPGAVHGNLIDWGSLSFSALLGNVPDLTDMVDRYANACSGLLGKFVVNQGAAAGMSDMFMWMIYMAPVVVAMIIIIMAKFTSVLLVLVGPVVFFASLIGYNNNYLMLWFRQLLVMALTVILTFLIFGVVLTMLTGMAENIATLPTQDIEIATLFPLAVMSVVGFVLISQAPALAGSLLGAAGINTGQITGLVQLAAMRSAK